MFFATGSNLQGQWINNKLILNYFSTQTANIDNFYLDHAKLVHITWSYNIFVSNNKYYIVGSLFGKENQCLEVKIPNNILETFLIGNEHKLYLISRKSNEFWLLDLNVAKDWEWIHRDFNLNINYPEDPKKRKVISDHAVFIQKVGLTVSALIVLYSDGSLSEWPNKISSKKFQGKIVDFVCGYEHILVLTDVGFVYSFGNGRRCQLGHGELTSLEEPKLIEGLAGIKIIQIKAGGWHSLALSEHGDLYAWGWNDSGQLGIIERDEKKNFKEHTKNYAFPTVVEFYDVNREVLEINIKQIACGSRHSAVLVEDNSVWTTGFNSYGQLGICSEQFKSLNYFKKVFQCRSNLELFCGHWSSVLTDNA